MKNSVPKKERLPCPFCKEERADKIRFNGSYILKNTADDESAVVPRFLCRSCGQGYTKSTNVAPAWNYGYEERGKRLTMKTTPIAEWNERNVGPTFKKLKSHHNQKNEDELFKKIDDLIVEKGFLEVSKVKSRLKIGTSTYYRYMKKLKHRLFWNENTKTARSQAALDKALLLELKTKIVIESGQKPEILRVFILFDKETQIAYDYFLVRKKKLHRIYQFNEQVARFGHFYITPELIKHLKQLKNLSPNLVIELDCEKATTKRLLKYTPHLFKPTARYTRTFWQNLERYKMRRNLTFGWKIALKKQEKQPSANSPAWELHQDLYMLLSIYNQHHIARLTKTDK